MASKQFKSLGCQDLLLAGNASGVWLRKQKKVFAKVLSPSGGWWYRRYAVIHENCIYFFKDEYSESCSDSIILHNCKITSVDKPIPNYPPWCFTIETNDTNKKHWFSISSSKELREIILLLSQACTHVGMRQCTLSKKPEKRISSGIESDNSAGSHFVESNNSAGNHYVESNNSARSHYVESNYSAGNHYVDEDDTDDDEDEKVDEHEYEAVGDFASETGYYLAMSPTTLSHRHATLLRTVSPDSEPLYVNHSAIKNRGRPVPMVLSIAENSDEDYPQDPVPVPPTDNDRMLHLPVQADMSVVEPAAAAAAPCTMQQPCSGRIAVEHVDTSNESSRLSPRAHPAATQPKVYLSELGERLSQRTERQFWDRVHWTGTTEEAQIHLKSKATEGMYLIRDGSEGKVLMYYGNNKCHKCAIKRDEHGKYYIATDKLSFESIRDLINFYSGKCLQMAYND